MKAFDTELVIDEISTETRLYFNCDGFDRAYCIINDVEVQFDIFHYEHVKYLAVGTMLNYNDSKVLEIIFENNRGNKYKLPIYYDAVYNDKKSFILVDYDLNRIEFLISVFGKRKNAVIKMKLIDSNGVFYDEQIELNTLFYVESNTNDVSIKCIIYYEKASMVGFKRVVEENIIYSDKINYYTIKTLINKHLHIKSAKLLSLDDEVEDKYDAIQFLAVKINKKSDIYQGVYIGQIDKIICDSVTPIDRFSEVYIKINTPYIENGKNYMDLDVYEIVDGVKEYLQHDYGRSIALVYSRSFDEIESLKIDLERSVN